MKSEVSQHESGSSLRIYDGSALSVMEGELLENKLRSFSSKTAISLCYSK